MTQIIAFANQKGGTGKTTSCLSIAGFLAKGGSKVLVVDLDPQGSATRGLGIDSTSSRYSIYDAILKYCDGYEGVPVSRVIARTSVDNLHIVPSEFDLAVAEILLQRVRGKTGILNRILEEVRSAYDYILIDLPPSSGLLAINGLRAADTVIVPVEPSIFCLESLDNLKKTFKEIKRLTRHAIDRVMVLLVRYVEPNTFVDMFGKPNPSQDVEKRLLQLFRSISLVPESSEIYEAQKKGLPISHYAPKSRVGKAYQRITDKLVKSSQTTVREN